MKRPLLPRSYLYIGVLVFRAMATNGDLSVEPACFDCGGFRTPLCVREIEQRQRRKATTTTTEASFMECGCRYKWRNTGKGGGRAGVWEEGGERSREFTSKAGPESAEHTAAAQNAA